MTQRILTAHIGSELDVVGARQRARQIAALCGFGVQDQVRIATAVSELARNVYNYAGSGKVHFAIDGQTAPQVLSIRIEDQGPGIAQLDQILAGSYRSPTGMGLGILGAQRLMDRCHIHSAPQWGQKICNMGISPVSGRQRLRRVRRSGHRCGTGQWKTARPAGAFRPWPGWRQTRCPNPGWP